MFGNTDFAAAFFIFIGASFAITYVLPLIGLLRGAIEENKAELASVDYTPTPLHQAFLEEVMELGFHTHSPFIAKHYGSEHYGFFLTHDTLPVLACVCFRPWMNLSYQVSFSSLLPNGTTVETYNCQPGLLPFPEVQWQDAYAKSLAEHFQLHCDRIRNLDVTSGDRPDRIGNVTDFANKYLAYQEKTGKFVRSKTGKIYYSFGAAFRTALEIVKIRKIMRYGYSSKVTTEAYQSEFFAECYDYQEYLLQQRKTRPSVDFLVLVVVFAITFIFFSLLDGKGFASWFLSLFVMRGIGHAIALRMFGYHVHSLFALPMFSAMVSDPSKSITTWKQAAIILSGTLPGFLLGAALWICYHAGYGIPKEAFKLGLATIAVNSILLLPFTPLDGGKLLEISVFSRWKRFKHVFYWLSCLACLAAGIYLQDLMPLILVFCFGNAALRQKNILRVSQERCIDTTETKTLPELFALARSASKNKNNFCAQYFIVRPIFRPSAIQQPRMWETVSIIALLIVFWCYVGITAHNFEKSHPENRHHYVTSTVLEYYPA